MVPAPILAARPAGLFGIIVRREVVTFAISHAVALVPAAESGAYILSTLPIADYALLSNCRTAALVSRSGSIDWLCCPRFDGASMFGRLLDDRAGHWVIRPTTHAEVSRRYIDMTMALETTYRTPTGTAVLVDALALGMHERGHRLGFKSPSLVMRRVTCVSGHVDLEAECAPHPEYGLITPLCSRVEGGAVIRGGADALTLSSTVPVQIGSGVVTAQFSLEAGEEACFALQHRSSSQPAARAMKAKEIGLRIDDTLEAWRTWSQLHQRYQGPWKDMVWHSGRVLQALTFQPTGAIVAAPTTSLPESVGGERNWDYRYTWVRDASMTLEALWVGACPDEARAFYQWIVRTVAGQLHAGNELQIMFGIGGEHDLSERTIPQLGGWRSSRPVRVGNGAWVQRQLDVYGELMRAAQLLSTEIGGFDQPTRQFLIAAADSAARRWQEPDQGIWEARSKPRHYLYSKLMCWCALDSAIQMAGPLHARARVRDWTQVRDKIREAILMKGWSKRANAYTQSFGSDALDASALQMVITGFLPGDDPRMRATIATIAEKLVDERGLVYRYKSADGLAGDEGSFLLCTFWLAQAFALAGEADAARATFEHAAGFANDVGLLSEEVDGKTGELLGNFPQAFSHIGLVRAAWVISQLDAPNPETSAIKGLA
jgi:alpha,alpha-trehalase